MYAEKFIDDPYAHAAAIASSLFVSIEAIEAGDDLCVDGTPADELYTDALLSLLDSEAPPAYGALLASMSANDPGQQAALRQDILMLIRAQQDEFDVTAQTIAPDLRSKLYGKLVSFTHQYWDSGIKFPYEMGNTAWDELEIFAIIVHRSLDKKLPGWTGQVRKRFEQQLEHDKPAFYDTAVYEPSGS